MSDSSIRSKPVIDQPSSHAVLEHAAHVLLRDRERPELLEVVGELGPDELEVLLLDAAQHLRGGRAPGDGRALERLPEEEYRWYLSWPCVQEVSLKPEVTEAHSRRGVELKAND
jgi:hypothetical protein